MYSSAELIEALRRRARRSLRPERPAGEFPPGWSAWFKALGERVGAVTGATAQSIIDLLMVREPAPAPRAAIELNRWRSFGSLWRQQWHPASQDERWVRWVAIALTVLVHLVLAVLLLWLAYVRFMGLPPAAEEGDSTVQVEFIGEGTPEDEGGGPPPGDTAEPTAAAAAASAAGEVTPTPVRADPQSAPAAAAAEMVVPIVEIPPPQEPAPSAAQPLQVTEVAVPDSTFTLPPPILRTTRLPQPRMPVPEVRMSAPEVRVVDIPVPVAPSLRPLPQRDPVVPRIRTRPAEIVLRDIPTPLPPVPTRALPQVAIAVPELRTQAPRVATREVPMPPGAASRAPAATGSAATPASEGVASSATAPRGTARAASSSDPGGSSQARSGTQPAAASSGSGTSPAVRPGAAATAKRGDDWGASDRNRPGGQGGRAPGLFNPDGTPRLSPGSSAAPGGGLPPGTIEQKIANLDRAGSWLKRKPNNFEPTSLDQYWVPHETLLAEWVRKSIKEVLIPIPGTSKKIKCSVVLLALGGGCGITDANLVDIEATARPPPDVPFKRELQEDQESLGN